MPPKFQSSFIPKGPIASGMSVAPGFKGRQKDLLSFLAKLVFGLSVLLALGVTLYKVYLNYSIKELGSELETMRAEFSEEAVGELVRLNDRMASTEVLLNNHRVLSPVLTLLEQSTPRTVRFVEFGYLTSAEGPQLTLRGEAQGYGALSLLADIIYKNPNLKKPIFSDIRLDDRGNVAFSFTAFVSPDLISYKRATAGVKPPVQSVATSSTPVATSTPRVQTQATSTSGQATTSPPRTN